MRVLGDRVMARALDRRDPRASQPALDVAGQVKLEMAGSFCRREVSRARRVMCEKWPREFRAYFVRALGDARADTSANSGPFCAQRLHPVESSLDDPGKRAAPAAVRRANDICHRIREQDRGTIGGKDTQGNAGNARDQAIGPWSRITWPRLFHRNHGGAMDLITGHQPVGGKAQPFRCNGSIAFNRLNCIARSEPAIQRLKETAADPTLAGKEGVAYSGSVIEKIEGDHCCAGSFV